MKIKIKKGKHNPFPYINFPKLVFLRKNKYYLLSKIIKFNESAIYNFEDIDQHDINKLYGFSIGYHHKNSIRFGWRPNKTLNKIEIVGYEYINGLRVPEIPICEVELNEWYLFDIEYFPETKSIVYTVENNSNKFSTEHPIKLKRKLNIGYHLYLYFGGNRTAPHDIKIDIVK